MPVQDSHTEGTFESTADQVRMEYHDWRLWQMLFPYLIYLLMLVAALLFTERLAKVAEMVSQGDLLLLSSVLLIGVFSYFSQVRSADVGLETSIRVRRSERYALFFGILVLVAYTIVKIYSVNEPYPESVLPVTPESGDLTLTAYFVLAFVVAIAIFGWSYAGHLRKWVYKQRLECEANQ